MAKRVKKAEIIELTPHASGVIDGNVMHLFADSSPAQWDDPTLLENLLCASSQTEFESLLAKVSPEDMVTLLMRPLSYLNSDVLALPGTEVFVGRIAEFVHNKQNFMNNLMNAREGTLEKLFDHHVDGLLLKLSEEVVRKDVCKESVDAEELYYKAMDADELDEHIGLLQETLSLDPWHTDAWLALLSEAGLKVEKEIEALQRMKILAERRLGRKAFKEYAGHFWGFIETRPYMRVCAELGDALEYAKRYEEAAHERESMLELNPGDNQGIRYLLLPLYLRMRKNADAARLFQVYPNDCEWNTVFAWCRVLDCWMQNDTIGAEDALAAARKQNPHTELYLIGKRRLPNAQPDFYRPGDDSESKVHAREIVSVWKCYPQALAWLKNRIGASTKSASKKIGTRRQAK